MYLFHEANGLIRIISNHLESFGIMWDHLKFTVYIKFTKYISIICLMNKLKNYQNKNVINFYNTEEIAIIDNPTYSP